MRSPLPHQLPYRADIDGLRAVAILSVVVYHYFSRPLPGGFIGVDVFFVISGFLISSLIFDAAQQNKFSYRDFYGRRIRRLLPALLIVLVAVFIAGAFILYPAEYRQLNKLALGAVFFVPNFVVWTQTGYFGGIPEQTPLLHLWSLGVEEQFYLLWPLLAVTFWNKRLPWIIGLIAAASFAANMLFIAKYPDAVFYFPFTRLWELLAGSFLAWRERRHLHSALGTATDLPAWLRQTFSILGLAILLGCGWLINSDMPFPGWLALPPVLATMMLIAAGKDALVNRHILAHPLAVGIGLISYPLYLWHWPIRSFLDIVEIDLPAANRATALLAAFLLAWLTYQFVEKPIRSLRAGQRRRVITVLLIIGAGLMGAVSTATVAESGFPQFYPKSLLPFVVYDYLGHIPYTNICFLQAGQGIKYWEQSKCIDRQTSPPEPLLVFWGDSHAADLRFGLEMLQRSRKFRLGEMTRAGCTPFINFDVPGTPACRSGTEEYLHKIVQLKPDILVISASWPDNLDKFDQTIKALKWGGIQHIVVIGPVPLWDYALPDIIIRNAIDNDNQIPTSLGPDEYQVEPEAGLRHLVTRNSVSYISAFDALCPSGRCVAMTHSTPQYVTFNDTNHLTVAGSELLMRRIGDQIFAGVDVAKR